MNGATRTSAIVLGLVLAASVSACGVSDPYSQKNGRSTNAPPSQGYQESYVQPSYGQPIYPQPAYNQPQYAQQGLELPYDRISQSEGASIFRNSCDRNLLATTPEGAANQFVGGTTGPMVAGNIQSGMTPVDSGCVGLTLEYARTNQPVSWQNPTNGIAYQVTPLSAYQAPNGLNCREYTTAASLNGRSERINDTACRMPNGLWQFQS
jgi:surface antigen